MKTIYIVRHCKADGQAPDAQLTEPGHQQALRLAAFFSTKSIERIYSSPYERARSSIAPLADELGLAILLDDRLAERVLAGQNHPDWRDRLKQTYDDLNLCYEGGESSQAAMNRAVRVVMEVLDTGCSQAVLVSHGNLISLLLKYFDPGFGFAEWERMSNPDVYQLSFADGAVKLQRAWTE